MLPTIRTSLVLIIAALCTPHVSAADCLEEVVSLVGWSAKSEGNHTRVGIGLRNEGDLDIAMVKGTVRFTDPFGDALLPELDLFPDTAIAAGSPGHIGAYTFPPDVRLAHVDAKMVTPMLCLTGVVFSDGTKRQAGG